ncbi:hypothetical protein [Erwinia rhapontici]|uniref:hypothetical protein n=1 Tax=Erwinia rhapontici TaxID=55212 RepID=UPI0021690B8A|nr:hypothetical protein [Erwinia rhapontici]MCS3605283.1 hypothetical protein [Erwinia rhapontici]
MKELIEQIGGRAALQDLINNPRMANCDETAFLARALLAVLDAKPVGTVSIAMDWSTHRNIATVNMRPDLVLSEMRDGDNLYTTPPAASEPVSKGYTLPDGWKLVPIEPNWSMLNAAINFHEGEAFLPASLYKAMLAAAPAPGGDQ